FSSNGSILFYLELFVYKAMTVRKRKFCCGTKHDLVRAPIKEKFLNSKPSCPKGQYLKTRHFD
ncbi:hypothetical protein, partial [Legionella shakespearei]|uniref:hypothetical protein n=1 Tax=Legionella shakespearei TaxID=45075 RepID=UPI001ED99B3B